MRHEVAHVWRGERPRRTTSSPVVRTECWACEDRPQGRERSRLSVHRELHRPQGPRMAPKQFSPVSKLDAVSDGFNVPEARNVQDDRRRPLWWPALLGLKERRGYRTGQPSGSKSVACEERHALNVGGPCTSLVRPGYAKATTGAGQKGAEESDRRVVLGARESRVHGEGDGAVAPCGMPAWAVRTTDKTMQPVATIQRGCVSYARAMRLSEQQRRARCGKTARRDLCGGRPVRGVPTARQREDERMA